MVQTSQVERAGSLVHCDQALGRRLEGAEARGNAEFVEARAKAFPETRGEWMEVAGAYAMFDGTDSPCTQTFGLGLFDPVADIEIAQLEQFFEQRGADVFHEVCPLADASLLSLLGERGYLPVEWSNVLVRTIQPGDARASSSDTAIHVRPIASDEHDLWARTAAAGWADVAPGLEDFLFGLGWVNPHRPNTHCFVAEKQGKPIATAAVCLSDGVAVLAGASTVPAWRRQGAQLALHEHRLQFAVEKGCDIAMVVALPGSASQRNAERHGFRVAYTRTKWHLALKRTDTDGSAA